MIDRSLLEVEEKDLAEENSLDSQDENPYLSSAKELYREKEISRRKKVVETMRQQDEALRRNQSIAVIVSDEEMAHREEKAEQRLKIREESFGRNNGYEVPLSRDEEVLLKKKRLKEAIKQAKHWM